MNSKVTHINVGNLAENCWFLANEDTKEAVVIDPGAEPDRICAAAEKHGWKITAILLTHGHIDHMGACESLRTELGVKVYALTEEEDLLLDAKKNLSVFIERKVVTFEPDELLRDGQELTLAGMKIQVIHTPGHTPGSVLFLTKDAIFTGDTIFQGSIGRMLLLCGRCRLRVLGRYPVRRVCGQKRFSRWKYICISSCGKRKTLFIAR